jgi:hypothetical protein
MLPLIISNKEILDFCDLHPDFNIEVLILSIIRSCTPKINQNTNELGENLVEFKNALLRDIKDVPFTIDTSLISESMSSVITPLVSNKLDSFTFLHNKNNIEMLSVMEDVKSHLKKYETVKKGIETELEFKYLLEKEFPMCEITNIGSRDQKGKADINIIQENRPLIMLELKNYTNTVPKRETEKFERDLLLSGNHGILFAPFSGIYNKRHFQVSLINTSISVYISNTGMCVNDIRNAIEIIYFMDELFKSDKSISFSKDTMGLVNGLLEKQYENTKRVRQHLMDALKICDTVFMDDIKNLLRFSDNKKNECKKCGKTFKTVKPYENHIEKCV